MRRLQQKNTSPVSGRLRSGWALLWLLCLIAPGALQGQNPGLPELAPGAPASSYPLSGIDNINYYNGNLGIHIPVAAIGARGSVGQSIFVPIQRQWATDGGKIPYTSIGPPNQNGVIYSLGYLTMHSTSNYPYYCTNVDNVTEWAPSATGRALTWIVWTAPDGTEIVLADTKTGGQGQPIAGNDCGPTYQPANRGTVFRSYDGSGITFVSNTDVYDGDMRESVPSGTLYFRDGTRYLFGANGLSLVKAEDRNGNFVSWAFASSYWGGTYTITDSAGRNTAFAFTESAKAGQPESTVDTISWQGTGGAQRQTKVNYSQLSDLIGEGNTQYYNCLFPELDDASSANKFDPWLVSSITLANGRSYTFDYDVYGEVIKLTLPTGGYYTYTYSGSPCAFNGYPAGLVSGSSGVQHASGTSSIYRRVLERDEYAQGGSVPTAKVAISAAPNTPGAGQTRVTVLYCNGTNRDGTSNPCDGTGTNLLKKEYHDFVGDPTSAAAIPSDPTLFSAWNDGREFQTTTIDPALGTLQTRQVTIVQRPCSTDLNYDSANCALQGNTGNPSALPPHDPQIQEIDTTLGDLGSGPMSGITFLYDQYNNQTCMWEFDFGATPAVGTGCPTGAPSGFRRETATTYKTDPTTDSSYISVPTPITGNSSATQPYLVSLPVSRTMYDASGTMAAKDAWNYDESTITTASGMAQHDDTNYSVSNQTRGNVTTHTVNTTASATASETFVYDQTGSLITASDFNGNATTFTYDSVRHVSPTVVVSALDAANGGSATSTAWNTRYDYDLNTLKVNSVTDENSSVTTYTYADLLDRLTDVQRGAATQSHTTYIYEPDGSKITTQQDQTTPGGGEIRTETLYDLLGRPIQTNQYEDGGGYIATAQSYDGLGRVVATSDPTRGTLVNSAAYSYDALGRPQSAITTVDNSATQFSYAPNADNTGETITVTDPAGHTRRTTTDALGRMVKVEEDPFGSDVVTQYGYNMLNNLTTVTQAQSPPAPTQTRYFDYNSRGWLTSATNPEANGVAETWQYDNNGNPIYRQDPRGIETCYAYDVANRVTLQAYFTGSASGACSQIPNNTTAPNTPNVNYSYDTGIPNAHGRLVSISNSAAVDQILGYDELGRVTGSNQTIGGVSRPAFSYAYNLADAVVQTVYPSTRTVTNTYDKANRIASVSGTMGTASPVTYVSGTCVSNTSICYEPSGAPTSYSYYNGLSRANTYNSRLQPLTFTDTKGTSTLFSLGYTFGTSTTNNGNPTQITIGGEGAGSGYTQNYGYDALNRLCAAGEATSPVTITNCAAPTTGVNWAQNFSYDRFGNVWAPAASQAGLSGVPALGWMPAAQSSIDPATNRLTSTTGALYDGAGGNQTTFLGTSTSSPMQYDAENHLRQVVDGSGNTWQYTYDGLGARVSRTNVGSGVVTYYLHDVFGNLATEYNPLVATPCATCYLSWDHLGSTRMVTNESGTIVARHDYLPYGVEIPRSGTWSVTDGLSPKFTGQDYDGETLLAFYQARHLASGLGRFMSVDPGNAGADLENPQSWNMYSYGGGNPMVYVDPDGLDPCQPFDESGYCGESGAGVWNDDWFPWPIWGGGDGGSSDSVNAPNPAIIRPSPSQQVGPGNGFLGPLAPVAVGAGGLGGDIVWGSLGAICVGSGACEIAAVGAGVAAVAALIIYSVRHPVIPGDWVKQPSRKGGGEVYVNPKNPGDRIRIMPGNPASPFPAQRRPYWKDQRNGKCYDVKGGEVPCGSEAAHIPMK